MCDLFTCDIRIADVKTGVRFTDRLGSHPDPHNNWEYRQEQRVLLTAPVDVYLTRVSIIVISESLEINEYFMNVEVLEFK